MTAEAVPEVPEPPSTLADSGAALWRSLLSRYIFAQHELHTLEWACRQVDDLALLEQAIEEQGATVVGSAGQPRLNPAITEARQARLALAKLLGSLALPAEDVADAPVLTERQKRAKHAADVRWSLEREKEARRGSRSA